MARAIDMVNNEGVNLTQAAKICGVPRQTLKDRISNKYQKAGAGRPTELTMEEETELVRYIKFMAKIGHPLKINQIKCFAGDIAKDNGVSRFGELGPGWTWWNKFHKRHPDIKLRTPDTLNRGRAAMAR